MTSEGSSIVTGKQLLRELRDSGALSYQSSPEQIYKSVLQRSGEVEVAEAAVYAALGSSNQTKRIISAIKHK